MSQFVVVTSAYKDDHKIRSAIISIVEQVKKLYLEQNIDIDHLEYCETRDVPDNIIVGEGLLKDSQAARKIIQNERKFDGITISRTPLVYVDEDQIENKFSLICTRLASSNSTSMQLVCLTTNYHTVDAIPYYMFIKDKETFNLSLYDQYVTERTDIVCLLPLFFIPLKSSPNFEFLPQDEKPGRGSRSCRQKELDCMPEQNLMRCGEVSLKLLPSHECIASWNRTDITHAITVDNGWNGWVTLNHWVSRLKNSRYAAKQNPTEFNTYKDFISVPSHITIAVIYIPDKLIDRMVSEKDEFVSEINERLNPHNYRYTLKNDNASLVDFGPVMVLQLEYGKPPTPSSSYTTESVRDIILDVLEKRYGSHGLKLADNRDNPHFTMVQSSNRDIKLKIAKVWESIPKKNPPYFEFKTLNFITINRRGTDSVLLSGSLRPPHQIV